jgi:hypothetical protein
MVPVWQTAIQRGELRRQGLHDGGRLNAGSDVGLHGYRGSPVPAPDDWVFLAIVDRGDLA